MPKSPWLPLAPSSVPACNIARADNVATLFDTGVDTMSRDRTPHSHLPVAVAAGVAVLGIASLMMFNLLEPGSLETKGAGMITAAAAERAGATVIPSATVDVAPSGVANGAQDFFSF